MDPERANLIAARDGDQAAFGELVRMHQSAVYNLAYRMLANRVESEDAAQETFMRAYANLDRYDMERPFRTWLLSITSNYCIDRLRRRRLTWLSLEEPLPPTAALHSDETEPEDAVIEDERNAMIQALLAELAPDYRAAVVLHYWYDYSYAEIADILDTTESAVKSRLFRARQTLAARLSGNAANATVSTGAGASTSIPVNGVNTSAGRTGKERHSRLILAGEET